MSDIDVPALKHIMWHEMRRDLQTYVPYFADNDLLLCPVCLRPLGFDDFSVEHIIPRQAVASDPAGARNAIPRNVRSGVTLLCQAPLYIKGRQVYPKGCNSWKGKYFDSFLRNIFDPAWDNSKVTSRHQVSLFCAGYLALFQKYGYQIALSPPSGVIMRGQFFSPDKFLEAVPIPSQLILMGQAAAAYSEDQREFWSIPFDFTVNPNSSVIVRVRNAVLCLYLAHNPETPLALSLPYAPPAYKLLPDLRTVFT